MASPAFVLKSAALRLMPDAMLLPLKKVRYLAAVRSFRSPEAEVMAALVELGDHVLDVGAHAGWYTRVLSEAVGPQGRVYSLEPIPITFGLLTFCVRRLRLNNVTLFNCAASRENGTAVMTVPSYPTGGENFYRASLLPSREGSRGTRQFAVDLRTLDSLLPSLSRPISFIKCDVEGHEADVLEGGTRTIERDRPSLCVEVSGDPDAPGSTAQELFASLTRLGYSAYRLDGDGLVARRRGDRSVNYFFLTASHREQLVTRGIVRGTLDEDSLAGPPPPLPASRSGEIRP